MNDPKQNIVPQYLDLLDAQREAAFQTLVGLTPDQIWQRPAPREWCIGEILGHNLRLLHSAFPFVQLSWRLGRPLAKLWRQRDYKTRIADPYRRDRFPMWMGFLWRPKATPRSPIPLTKLTEKLRTTHRRIREFYTGKPEDLLGNLFLFDPMIGVINLILTLRIMLYHDQLHYEDVIRMAANLRKTS